VTLPTEAVVAALLAVGPRRWLLASAWTLHAALADLDQAATAAGLLAAWDRRP